MIFSNTSNKRWKVYTGRLSFRRFLPGLKVFTNAWIEINENETGKMLKPGMKVYIGIQTIDEADIDRARIKINEKDWNVAHITSQFNKDKKVYYREYTVASSESKLKLTPSFIPRLTAGWGIDMKKSNITTIILLVVTFGLVGAIAYFSMLLNNKSGTAVTQIKKQKQALRHIINYLH